jgi:hypothetical protein
MVTLFTTLVAAINRIVGLVFQRAIRKTWR